MTLRDEHYVNLKGKTFVLYQGLLSLAHERGLVGVYTELLQVPSPDNGDVAIVKARVSLVGKDGEPLVFEGLGDSGPHNTGKMIAPHAIRHAETRAKARALRDAVGIGTTSLEELGDDAGEDAPRAPQTSPGSRSTRYTTAAPQTANAAPEKSSGGERTPGGATKKQLDFLEALIPDVSVWEEENGRGLSELTGRQASDLIGKLRGKP